MEKVDVSLKEARADIRLKPGTRLDVAKLRGTVTKAGFTPTWVEFVAVGHLVDRNGRAAFEVKGSGQVLPLRETEELTQLRQKAPDKEVAITARIPEKEEAIQIKTFQAQ